MAFQRTYCSVNTVWPPLLDGLLHPHYHTSDRIIRGVHIFIKGSSGPTRVLTESKAIKRAMEQRRLEIASEIDKKILSIIQKMRGLTLPKIYHHTLGFVSRHIT